MAAQTIREKRCACLMAILTWRVPAPERAAFSASRGARSPSLQPTSFRGFQNLYSEFALSSVQTILAHE